jgi:hypothetical protein
MKRNIVFGTLGTERMRIKENGNVGIGTTSPDTDLHIYGSTSQTNIFLGETGTPDKAGIIKYYQGDNSSNPGRLAFGSWGDNFSTGASTMCIKKGGNVGIGTTNPTHQLHIGPKDNDHIYLASSNNSYGWTIDTDDQGSGTVPFRIIKRTGGVDSTVLTIKNQDGKIGIGTTSPSHPLTIQETTTNTNTVTYPLAIRAISSGTVANGFGAGIRFQCERRDTDDYQSLAGSVEVYGAGNLPGTSDLWNMRFGVRYNDTAVTPMTLRYDGNVGIGTSNPTSLLHIVNPSTTSRDVTVKILGGPNQATNDASRATLELHDDYNNAQGWGGYIQGFHRSGVNHGMGLGTFTNGSRDGYTMFIQGGTGRVGIGTTSPNENLEIYGTGMRIHDPSSSPKLDFVRGGTSRSPNTSTFGQSNYSDWRITANGPSLYFQNQYTGANSGNLLTAMTIAHNSGNVGIGTTSPVAKLTLNAYGSEQGTSCLIIGANTGSQNLRIGCNSSSNYCWIQSHHGKPLRLNPAGNSIQYGTSNTTLSDDRIKDNEVYIENATDTLLKLKPQVYDKKLIWNISKLGETSNVNVVRESGLITQDVWYDAPELRHLVHLGEGAEPGEDKPVTDNDPTIDPDYTSWGDNVSLIEYTGLIPYLIKSNQEIYTELQTEKTKVADLLARVEALENA